jgi:hypothetical protein
MAKRFTGTDKWDKAWFRKLSPRLKCLWQYLVDRCDQAGVWEVDFDSASHFVNDPTPITKQDLKALGDRIEWIRQNKIWIVDFVDYQCGQLSKKSPAHKPVFKLLEKYGLLDRVLHRVSDSLQEEEKEVEIEKELEVEIEPEVYGKSENYFLGNIPDDIQKYAESLKPSGLKADEWQRVVASDIQAMGYEIQLETACPYLKEDGHRTEGFIDIRAVKGNDVVCIECDGRVTTYDSIAKIHTYAVIMKEYEHLEYSGMVILRDPKPATIVIQANVPAKPLTTSSTAIIKYPFQSPAFMEQWARWLKYRKDIKKPYKSDDSQQEQLNVLARYDEATAIEMIKQSIANTWQGIFEVKKDNYDRNTNQGTTTPASTIQRPGKAFGKL